MARQKTEDLYIAMLRYGREHLVDGVTSSDTLAHLRSVYPEAPLLNDAVSFHNTFFQAFSPIAGEVDDETTRRQTLSMEGYFNLLEHEELQQARQSSRNALRVAIGAIIISAILSAASIVLDVIDRLT